MKIIMSRYDRGFCRHGPHCRHRHVRRVLCINYLAGFCPDGRICKFMHPRFELPAPPEQTKDAKRLPICHYCSEVGHKATTCNKIPQEVNRNCNISYNIVYIQEYCTAVLSQSWDVLQIYYLYLSIDRLMKVEKTPIPWDAIWYQKCK